MREKPARAYDKRNVPERINGNGSKEFPAKVPSTYDRFLKRTEGKSVRDEVNERIGIAKGRNISENHTDMAVKKEKEGVSVCLTAWKTSEFIEQCLDSIERQTYFKGFNDYEILLGIDGCQETLDKVKSIMGKYRNLRVFMMDENCGTYITSNTMMSMAKYGWLLRFDTDDLMMPDMVETMFAKKGSASLVRVTMQNFFDVDSHHKKTGKSYGIHLVKSSLFRKVNGYKAWPCGGDDDFLRRCRRFGKETTLSEILMMRRVQQNSLTVSKKTTFGNPIREKYVNIVKTTDYSKEINCVNECIVTAPCHEVMMPKNQKTNWQFPDNSVIVSFTTYPKRDKYVSGMVESILSQDLKPDAVICWLSEEEYPKGTIPEGIKPYTENNTVSVRYLKGNTFGHKRYESIFEFGNCINILVDDDIVYGKTHISELVESAKKNPECVTCFYSDSVSYENGKIVHSALKAEPSISSDLLSGMSCFPPLVCGKVKWSRKYAFERDWVSEKCDDSWIKACLLKSGVKVVGIHDRLGNVPWETIEGTQSETIWLENKSLVNGVVRKVSNFIKSCVFFGCDLNKHFGMNEQDVKKCCCGEYEDLKKLSSANFGTVFAKHKGTSKNDSKPVSNDAHRKTSLPGIMAYYSI